MMSDESRMFRVALVGLGSMGRNHARVLLSLANVEFVAIVEPSAETKSHFGVPIYQSVDAIQHLGVDYCVIATPTSMHLEVALALADYRIACLIEKPLALTASQGRTIGDAFERRGVPAAVGHVERYNPAIQAMRERVNAGQLGRVFMMHTQRLSPFPGRIGDVGVTLDLATHDFDIARSVLSTEYREMHSVVLKQSGRLHEDAISVLAQMEDGTVVSHNVNWLSPIKERSIAITGERGLLVADTVLADLTLYANGVRGDSWAELAQFGGVQEGDVTRFALAKIEPLLAEHLDFQALVSNRANDACDINDGIKTLAAAERVLGGPSWEPRRVLLGAREEAQDGPDE